MPNSSCIISWKNQILSDLGNDENIIEALNLDKDENPEDLVWHRLFPHYYIPDVQESVKTYILVEIDIVEQRVSRYEKKSSVYSHPQITFRILSHQDDMQMKKQGISATRIDYIGYLIDKKYNKRKGFGIGRLQLISNLAGNLSDTYRVRELIFQGVDIDDSLCDDEEIDE